MFEVWPVKSIFSLYEVFSSPCVNCCAVSMPKILRILVVIEKPKTIAFCKQAVDPSQTLQLSHEPQGVGFGHPIFNSCADFPNQSFIRVIHEEQ